MDILLEYILNTQFKFIQYIAQKFIPLAFLLALTIFIHKHKQDGEFVILWTSGVKKFML